MRNSGVVITNIVFMILALILGVVSYFLFNNVSEKKQEIAYAQKALQDAKSENSSMTSDFTELKKKLGYEEVADARQLDETMRADVEKALGKSELNTSYRDVVVLLGDNLRQKKAELESGFKFQLEEAARVSLSEKNKTDNQANEFKTQEGTLSSEHKEAMARATKSKNELQESFDEQTQELNALKEETKKEIAVAKQETADFRESKERLSVINNDLRDQVEKLSNASYVMADAEVTYADQNLRLVRLNVGSRDGVRPLTTFRVFNPGTLDMTDATAKGSVQVVRAIGDHVCEAKILEDEMSNPVREGDLVYTPLWRPGEVMRFALGFRLDKNKDGRSDLDEITTIIRSAGAEVAAYFDDEGNIQNGDKIGSDIYAYVSSGKSTDEILDKDHSIDDATKEKILREETDLLKKLKDLDIPIIELDVFLDKIGYKETAGISRYREEGGVELQENGVGRQVVSPGVVAPNFIEGADKAPTSPGIVAPTYDKDADAAPQSTGTVSPYYERKRAGKSK